MGINGVDNDGDGNIDFKEFIPMMLRQINNEAGKEDGIREHFKEFDKNQDGLISGSELIDVMATLREKLNDDEVAEMIRMADVDGDGKVTYKEFVKMMMSE